MIIEGIICCCCFEDEQRILNSELESLLPLGTEAVCLTLSSLVSFADTCGCRVFDHGCALVGNTSDLEDWGAAFKLCQSESCTPCYLLCTQLLDLLSTDPETLSFSQPVGWLHWCGPVHLWGHSDSWFIKLDSVQAAGRSEKIIVFFKELQGWSGQLWLN